MRTFASAVVLLIAALDTPVFAQPLKIAAKFGFLGEYELSAAVPSQTSGGEHRLIGAMTVRHVGLCTHNGPNESYGEISIQVTDTNSQISATFAFDGQQCSYKGRVAQQNIGELICPTGAIPFSIWFDQ